MHFLNNVKIVQCTYFNIDIHHPEERKNLAMIISLVFLPGLFSCLFTDTEIITYYDTNVLIQKLTSLAFSSKMR